MHGHGKYRRTAVTRQRVSIVPVYRWRCVSCRKTTSVMPDFLAPYEQFVSVVREGVLRRHLRGWTVKQMAARTCTSSVGWLSERTVARWLAHVRKHAQAWTLELTEYLLCLRPGWDLFKHRWEGVGHLQALCDVGDACRTLRHDLDRHPGVYAYCNGLFPGFPRL